MCVPTAHNSRNVSNEAIWNHLVTTMFERAKQKLKTTCKTPYCIFWNADIWTYLRAVLTLLESATTLLSPQYLVRLWELKLSQLAFAVIRSAFNYLKLWQHIKWIHTSFEPWRKLMFWLLCYFKSNHLSVHYYRAL